MTDPPPLILDRDVLRLAGGRVLLGGDSGRLVRVRSADVLGRLIAGGARTPPLSAVARTLVEYGLAHPRPLPVAVRDVDVVVPVRDRPEELARCLRALGDAAPVLVVDDGSRAPLAVAQVCRAAGARLLTLPDNRGPAAARNAGLAATSGALVALVDSDCVPPPGWVAALAGHFADPAVGAVAPRVQAAPAGRSLLARYATARGPLDLGGREARVRPGGRVPYVPTAALVVRRAALPEGAFDPQLRHGEDVDLVWRLHDAGWIVRYDPRTVVAHAEPAHWAPWLARRWRYGASAAPLAARHGCRLAPLVLPPWPAAVGALLLTAHPRTAVAVAAVPVLRLHRLLRRADVPRREAAGAAVTMVARGVAATAGGLGGAGAVLTLPALLALLAPRRTRRTAALALLAPPLREWTQRRPALDPLRWTVLRLVDDAVYAGGVWAGCWHARTAAALRPRSGRPG